MNIRKAYYKAKLGQPTDMIIAGWTWLPNIGTPAYSHVEIGFEIMGEWWYFSSTSRSFDSNGEKRNGPRWIKADDLFKHPERWDVYEVKAMRPLKDMLDDAASMLGSKYDWWGIAGFATIIGIFNAVKDWYCSEAVNKVDTGKHIRTISPRAEYRLTKPRIIRKLKEEEYVNQKASTGNQPELHLKNDEGITNPEKLSTV